MKTATHFCLTRSTRPFLQHGVVSRGFARCSALFFVGLEESSAQADSLSGVRGKCRVTDRGSPEHYRRVVMSPMSSFIWSNKLQQGCVGSSMLLFWPGS